MGKASDYDPALKHGHLIYPENVLGGVLGGSGGGLSPVVQLDGVDGLTPASHSLYTVNLGKTFVFWGIIGWWTTLTNLSSHAAFSVGTNNPDYDNLNASLNLQFAGMGSGGVNPIVYAGEEIVLNLTAPNVAVADALVYSFALFGYEY